MSQRARNPATIALLAVLILAAVLRVWGLRFGLPEEYHPDETVRLSLLTLRDKGNPHFFNYPSFLLYLQGVLFALVYVFERVSGSVDSTQDWLTRLAVDPSQIFVAARGLSAALGVLTVALAYRLGLIFSRRSLAGLIAALTLAVALPHVQDSHFATVDIPLAFFVAAALLVMLGVADSRSWKRYLAAGILTGVAIGTKYPAGLLVLVMLVAHFQGRRSPFWRVQPEDKLFILFVATSFGTFLCTTPFCVISMGSFIRALRFEAGHAASGQVGFYTRSGLLFHLSRSLLPPVPWLFVPLAAVGLVRGLAWSRTRGKMLTITAFLLLYGATVCSSHLAFERYALPILPVVCGLFASGIVWVTDRILSKPAKVIVTAVLLGGAVLPSAWASVVHDRLLSTPDTRQVSAAWLRDRMSGGTVLYNLAPGNSEPSWHEPDPARLRVICMGEQRRNGEGPFRTWPRADYFMPSEVPSLGVLLQNKVKFVVVSSFRVTKYLDVRAQPDIPTRDADSAAISRVYEELQPYLARRFSPYSGTVLLRDDLPNKSLYSPSFPGLFDRVAPGPTVEIYELPG